jgi:hypothetical protein
MIFDLINHHRLKKKPTFVHRIYLEIEHGKRERGTALEENGARKDAKQNLAN